MPKKNTGTARAIILVFLVAVTMVSCVSTGVENQNSLPQIAVDEEGNSYITWVGWRTSCDEDDDIYWMKMSAEGIRSSMQKASTHVDNTRNRDSDPQIAVDPQKNSYVVWEGYDGEDSEIYWVKIDARGIPGETKKISVHPDNVENSDGNARIAVDSQGNSYVVWEGCKWGTFDCGIYWVKIDAEGVLGEARKISTHPYNEGYSDFLPDIAVDSQGNSYVVWEGHEEDESDDLGNYDILWVKIDREGTPGQVQEISALLGKERNLHRSPRIVVDSRGNSYVVWNGAVKDDNDTIWVGGIYWIMIDSEGIPGAIQRMPAHPDDMSGIGGYPRIVIDGEGKSHVVWPCCIGDECVYQVGDYEIQWVTINADGIPEEVMRMPVCLGNSEWVATEGEIAADPQGGFSVVWSCYGRKTIDVHWMRVDAEGVPGEVVKLSNYGGSDRFHDVSPRVAADARGNSYVTWYTYQMHGDQGIPYDVYWVRIDVSGTPGEPQRISVSDVPCESNRSSVCGAHPSAVIFHLYCFSAIVVSSVLSVIFKCTNES